METGLSLSFKAVKRNQAKNQGVRKIAFFVFPSRGSRVRSPLPAPMISIIKELTPEAFSSFVSIWVFIAPIIEILQLTQRLKRFRVGIKSSVVRGYYV